MITILLKILFWYLRLIVLVCLPFFALIRGAVFLYSHYGLNTWIALLGGMLFSAIVLTLYLTFISKRVFKTKLNLSYFKIQVWLVLILLTVYSGYTLIYVSKNNTKGSQVHQEFRSMHPFLRLGVGTLVLVDNELLITDMARVSEDYKKMGLKTKKRSLHYTQSDGYTHALDVRTVGRSEIKNWLLASYFKIMGFNTLRHMGTADHLHISLSPQDFPNSI